jgi:catechol 2,3-dioxygenase-like lactoylglutathione lyase family enzyme
MGRLVHPALTQRTVVGSARSHISRSTPRDPRRPSPIRSIEGVATWTGVSPVLLVSDLDRATTYYRDKLGFRCDVFGDPPDFATAKRDAVTLLLALCREPERIVPNWRIVDKIWDAYIRVDDVESVYAEVQQRGAPIDYTIYNAPSGFREFGVQDPDGHDIAFGQPL